MIPLLAVVGLCLSLTEGSYYAPVVPYGAAAGYIVPAYIPPYPTYQHHAPAADYYSAPVAAQKKEYKQDAKYYYGGKFQGSCSNDGLYYKDDMTFVICSNGYPSEMSCPPGTKTAEYPSYQAGYYYGYTDLCSVNLVDYGYGPSSYSASQKPVETGYNKDSFGYKDKSYGGSYEKDDYNAYPAPSKEVYTTAPKYGYSNPPAVDSYQSKPGYHTASKPAYNPSVPAPSYTPKNTYPPKAAEYPKDTYNKDPYSKDTYGKDTYGKESTYGKDTYGKDTYGKDPSYEKDSYSPSGSYPSASKYPTVKPAGYQSGGEYDSKAEKPSYSAKNPYVPKDINTAYDKQSATGYGSSSNIYQPQTDNKYPTNTFKQPADRFKATGYSASGADDKVTYPAKTKYADDTDRKSY